jgi:ATP-dependent helicase HrpB
MRLEPNVYPIDSQLADINQALETNNRIILKAQTGAGKTTRLPPYLAEHQKGKILVLEPRRLAAKLSAQRCQEVLPPHLVGHHIRLDKNIKETTRLIFITEGLFLNYLKQDNQLCDYSLIILDEFHERNVHTDIALSLVKRLQETTRPDLKLIVMSATLDTSSLESYLENPILFNVEGRIYPLTIDYQLKPLEEVLVELVHDPKNNGNTLVFLPGVGEILRAEATLKNCLPSSIEILTLYSNMSNQNQQKVFHDSDTKKVILATNIAETSVTVPKITAVVDTGLERRSSYAPWSGMPLLALTKISKAQAIQRAGRAGRVQAGQVIRLYSEADFHQRENFQPPEILRVDLAHHLLDLMALGITPAELVWPESPPEGHIQSALELLESLDAIEGHEITLVGKFMQELSLHPRLSRLLYQASENHLADLMLMAALLSEGSVLNANTHFSHDDQEGCDICLQLDLLKAYRFKDKDLSDYSFHQLDLKKTSRVFEWFSLLQSQLQNVQLRPVKTDHQLIRQKLLISYNDRLAMKRTTTGNKKGDAFYNLCLGRGAILTSKSALFGSRPELILVLDALEDVKANAAMGTKVVLATKVEFSDVASNNKYLTEEMETSFNEHKGVIELTAILRYRKLILKTQKRDPIFPRGESLLSSMLENWPWPFQDDSALMKYNQKVRLLNQSKIEHGLPRYEGEMLALFIESLVDEQTTYQNLLEQGLQNFIEQSLSLADLYLLQSLTPDEIVLANGKKMPINYLSHLPSIEAHVHDFYGLKEHPYIINNTCQLQIKLLNPAKRVCAQVVDLTRFWQTTWNEVRKELHGRYPKHFWPVRPDSAPSVMLKKKLEG